MQSYRQYQHIAARVHRGISDIEKNIDRSVKPPSPSEHDRDLGNVEQSRETSASPETRNISEGNTTIGGLLASKLTGQKDDATFLVGFDGETDPENPQNWPKWKKLTVTLLVTAISFVVNYATSADSAARTQAADDFHVSEVAESLATGIFLVGFGTGALIAGPISETIGRNAVYIGTMSLYLIFVMASGLAPNYGAQIVFRFLTGFFGATPLVCAGGTIVDVWAPVERIYAFPLFAVIGFTGSSFGPVVGGFVAESSLVSWRFTEWSTIIISGTVLVLAVLFQPETYSPILLDWKAAHLRKLTGDTRYKTKHHELLMIPFWQRLQTALYRPFVMAATEPILMLIALYMTIIYIVLFTFFEGYTFIFSKVYGMSDGATGLCFLGLAVGMLLSYSLVPFMYFAAVKNPSSLTPEFRLWFAMLGAPAIPISLFWMGWTDYSSISHWSPIIASSLFGYGMLCIFISSYQYVMDTFAEFTASALTSLTLIRYVVSGAIVEAAIPMYSNLGVHWALTLLGCLSALMVPVPYVFYTYGYKLRAASRTAGRK